MNTKSLALKQNDSNHYTKKTNSIKRRMMLTLFRHNYTDTEYVNGMKSGNRKIQSHFYNHCRDYFNHTYSKLFFTDNEQKNDIFEDSFIILWQKIERGDICVKDGVVMTKDGKQLKCNLKTFMMSIAWNKFREYTRKHREELFEDMFYSIKQTATKSISFSNNTKEDAEAIKFEIIATCVAKMPKRCNQILTMFYFEGKKLDTIMIELNTFTSKDALKTAKNKCFTTLKNNVLQQYKTAMINY